MKNTFKSHPGKLIITVLLMLCYMMAQPQNSIYFQENNYFNYLPNTCGCDDGHFQIGMDSLFFPNIKLKKSISGSLIDTTYCYKQSGSEWVYDNMYISIYDDGGFITTDYWYKRSEDETQWLKNQKLEYQYYASGNIKQILMYRENETYEFWVKNLLITYLDIVVDYFGRLNDESYKWDDSLQVWQNHKIFVNTFDSYGVLSKTVLQYWIDGAWQNDRKFDYQFYPTSKLKEYAYSPWDASINIWENEDLSEYYYDVYDNLELINHKKWNLDSSGYCNHRKSVYFNSQNRDSLIFYNWDNNLQIWKYSVRVYWEYNGNIQTDQTLQQWYGYWQNDNWVHDDINGLGQVIERRFYIWDDVFYDWYTDYKCLSEFYVSVDENQVDPPVKIIISNQYKGNFNIFVSGDRGISYTLDVYSISGRKVLQTSIVSNQENQLSLNLKSGVYLFVISKGNKFIHSQKAILY